MTSKVAAELEEPEEPEEAEEVRDAEGSEFPACVSNMKLHRHVFNQ